MYKLRWITPSTLTTHRQRHSAVKGYFSLLSCIVKTIKLYFHLARHQMCLSAQTPFVWAWHLITTVISVINNPSDLNPHKIFVFFSCWKTVMLWLQCYKQCKYSDSAVLLKIFPSSIVTALPVSHLHQSGAFLPMWLKTGIEFLTIKNKIW